MPGYTHRFTEIYTFPSVYITLDVAPDYRKASMNHYSKLATSIVRLLGVLAALLGLMGFLYAGLVPLILSGGSPEQAWQSARLLSSAIFLIAGIFLYFIGKPIGRLVGAGLE